MQSPVLKSSYIPLPADGAGRWLPARWIRTEYCHLAVPTEGYNYRSIIADTLGCWQKQSAFLFGENRCFFVQRSCFLRSRRLSGFCWQGETCLAGYRIADCCLFSEIGSPKQIWAGFRRYDIPRCDDKMYLPPGFPGHWVPAGYVRISYFLSSYPVSVPAFFRLTDKHGYPVLWIVLPFLR